MRLFLVLVLAALAQCAAWAATDPSVLKGEVLEVLDVDAYTYLRLKTADGEVWAAVGKAPVVKGAEVSIHDPSVMQDFESKALRRTFPVIVFGVLGVAAPEPAEATNPHGGMAAGDAMGYMHGAMKKAPEVAVTKVPKAEAADARTVAEVNTDRIALNGRPVTVRGQVVKVSNVLGKNWVHLRDGSGSGADGSNDLTVTSADEPKIGDVVVAKGTVKADVDIGNGYAFKVLVEDVTFAEK